jgi:hypothetical protein
MVAGMKEMGPEFRRLVDEAINLRCGGLRLGWT